LAETFDSTNDATERARVAVIGSGYVGLTLAACLASVGHDVHCTDVSIDRIARICQGDIPIVEEGLPELVVSMVACGRLTFGVSNVVAASQAAFVFLCLPTPEGADGHADLSFVTRVATEIGPHLHPDTVVINKSTVPVGTADRVKEALGRSDVHVVSNPEFLAEGTALRDSLKPDRIVIGARDPEVGQRVARLYGEIPADRMVITDVVSAELIKYASNAYLATRLTFVNSMAEMCETVGADIRAVTAGMGADHRIGPAFLKPGPGWGGSCFPKDTQALVRTAESLGCDLALVRTAIAENERHMQRIIDKVVAVLGGSAAGKQVAVWGLTFKAGTDDLRSSPSLAIARALLAQGARVRAYDPTVVEAIGDIAVASTMEAACERADVLLVATEWSEFATADLERIGRMMTQRNLIDGRNMIDPIEATDCGFHYVGVGLGHLVVDKERVAA
jgi:UDPglucose 6-dehydrogenase